MVLHAVVAVGCLLPHLVCPLPEVLTRGQDAHILAARAWPRASGCCPPPHLSALLPRHSSAIGEAARAGMVLALL
jgi:hypothetical protein